MRRLATCIACLFLALSPLLLGFAPVYTYAQAESPTIVVATVEGEITTGTAQYLARAYSEAEERNADYIVIQLDTPGGLVSATQEIVAGMLASEIETVVYVNKSGGAAFSAGTFMLMAADIAVVNGNASIGAAQPRSISGDSEPDPKVVSAMEAFMRSIAQATERDPELAARFVSENVTFTGDEALAAGIIDTTAPTLEAFIFERELMGAEIVRVEKSFLEGVLGLVSLPVVASLLLTIASLGILFSIRSGEFELILVFVPILFLALWSIGSLELSTVGFALFASALLLITIEIISPGFGYAGAAGSVLLIAAFLMLSNEPFFTLDMHGLVLYLAIGILLGILAIFFWISHSAVTALAQNPTTGVESLPGKSGRAVSAITPEGGTVMIESYRWNAVSEEPIEIDADIVVVSNENSTLTVKKKA